MSTRWTTSLTAFADAAGWFARTTTLVGDRWEQPGLGEWDVRSLVGHTSRALLTVEAYLRTPADEVRVESCARYFQVAAGRAADAEVAERGREAGAALGDDPVAAVAAIVERVPAVVAASEGTAIVATFAGGMRLIDYLPTRTFELVVHTLDLARALNVPADAPASAAAQALQVVTDLAVAAGQAGTLLSAATGRRGLPGDFTVL